jgi:hypothetical protein
VGICVTYNSHCEADKVEHKVTGNTKRLEVNNGNDSLLHEIFCLWWKEQLRKVGIAMQSLYSIQVFVCLFRIINSVEVPSTDMCKIKMQL